MGVVGITPKSIGVTPNKTGVDVKIAGGVAPEIVGKTVAIDNNVNTDLPVKADKPIEAVPDKPAEPDAKETLRPYELVAIGDLHGNLDIFAASLKSLGLIEAGADIRDLDSLKWVGGSRKLVLLGDIIGDREMEGLPILAAVRVLRAQAEALGGRIVLLAGNHEDFIISFLIGKKIAGLTKNENLDAIGSETDAIFQCIGGASGLQGLALMEFVEKYSDYIARAEKEVGVKFNDISDAAEYLGMAFTDNAATNLRKEVLENMRKSSEGKEILEQLCQMQLVEFDGETMFMHTELTLPILAELEGDESIEEIAGLINGAFQKGLRKLLLGQGEMPEKHEFYRLINIFLDTGNRSKEKSADEQISKYPEKFEALKKKGLKRFVHGHTDVSYTGVTKEIGGVEIVNIDVSAGKSGGKMDERSIFALAKDGKMEVGKSVQLDVVKVSAEKEIVKNMLVEVFSIGMDTVPEDVAVELVKLFGNISADQLKVKLEDGNLRSILAYLAVGIVGHVPTIDDKTKLLQLDAGEIHAVINFYNDDLQPEIAKGAKIDDLLKEIHDYGVKAAEIRKEWEKRHLAKQTLDDAAKAKAEEKAKVRLEAKKSAAIEARELPVDGKFDLSKSPTPDEEILKVDDSEVIYKEVEAKLKYLFADLSADDLKALNTYLNKLREENVQKFDKLIRLFYKYQREVRLLFSGELGGIRVLNFSNTQAGNKGFISAPKIMKLEEKTEYKSFANVLKIAAKGKMDKLKAFLDTLDGKDVSALRRAFNGAQAVFSWLEKL